MKPCDSINYFKLVSMIDGVRDQNFIEKCKLGTGHLATQIDPIFVLRRVRLDPVVIVIVFPLHVS